MDNAFLNTDFPARLAEYAAAMAERYRDRLRLWMPMNEPQITAMHCGEQGIWPPRLSGHDGYVKLVRAIVRGVVAAQSAVAEEVALLRARQFLIQDLLAGRVDDRHPLAGYLRRHGFGDDDLAWCAANVAEPDVLGINYYPHLTTIDYRPGERLPVARRPRRDDWTAGLEASLELVAGLYDLEADEIGTLHRRATPLVERFRSWTTSNGSRPG